MKDNLDLFNEYDKEQCEQLKRLPICDECGEPVESDFMYELGSENLCQDCFDEYVLSIRKKVQI